MFKCAVAKLFQNKNQTWTFYAQLARLLSGFAFVGLLAKTLPSEMLGTWYIFVSLFGVASLVEMGLGQVIGRHAAYMKADFDLGRISSADFLKFVRIGERFYLFLILAIGVIAVPAGLWWLGCRFVGWDNIAKVTDIGTLVSGLIGRFTEWNILGTTTVAWLVYVCGGMLTILGTYYASLVNGAGQMWQTQRAAIFAAGMSITVLLSLFVLPSMLLIPSTAMLLSQLLMVVLVRKALFNLDVTKVAMSANDAALLNTKDTLLSISKDAAKMFIIMLSYQLLTNGFVLVLSKYLTHHEIGSYGLTMQLIGVVMSLSMIWSQSNFFEIASNRQRGDTSALKKIFFAGLVRALGVALLGMFAVYFIAPTLLEILGSKTELLPPLLLVIVLSAAWFEFSLTQFSQLLIASGDMRVAYLSFLAALTICGSTTFLLSGGYTLFAVFMTRILLFCCCIGIPVLIISSKILRVRYSSKEVIHEAA